MNFKDLCNRFVKVPLVLRIVIGLAIGIVLGLLVPKATFISIFGKLFVSSLKAVAPVLVFILVASSLCDAGAGISGRFKTVIFLYILSTLIASFVAVGASFAFPISVPLEEAANTAGAPKDLAEVFSSLFLSMVQNPVHALSEGNYLGILTWAVLLGLALRKISDQTKTVAKELAQSVSTIVGWIIQLAPFGIMGIAFTTVSTEGLGVFATYGRLIILIISCMLIQALIVNPAIVAITLKQNPYPLVFRCLKNSAVTAFFTRSSAANIPVNMKLCEELGLDKDYYSVSIPLGATINMDGAAITIAIMSLAAAFSIGIDVTFPQALLLCVVATFGACGTSGVAGGSLLLIPMACSLLNIDQNIAMEMVGVGFIISVIQDSMETALNSSSDVLFTATAEFRERSKNQK